MLTRSVSSALVPAPKINSRLTSWARSVVGSGTILTSGSYVTAEMCVIVHFNDPWSRGYMIQTHKRFKRTLIYYNRDTQSANVRGNPLRQATKRYLNNSETVKKRRKKRWIIFCLVELLFSAWTNVVIWLHDLMCNQTRVVQLAMPHGRAQTPSTGLRHLSFNHCRI